MLSRVLSSTNFDRSHTTEFRLNYYYFIRFQKGKPIAFRVIVIASKLETVIFSKLNLFFVSLEDTHKKINEYFLFDRSTDRFLFGFRLNFKYFCLYSKHLSLISVSDRYHSTVNFIAMLRPITRKKKQNKQVNSTNNTIIV